MEAALVFSQTQPQKAGRPLTPPRLRIHVKRVASSPDRRKVWLRLSEQLAASLNWSEGDNIALLVGEGDDRGKIRLCRQDRSGGTWRLRKANSNARGGLQVLATIDMTWSGVDLSPCFDSFKEPANAAFTFNGNALTVTLEPLCLGSGTPLLSDEIHQGVGA